MVNYYTYGLYRCDDVRETGIMECVRSFYVCLRENGPLEVTYFAVRRSMQVKVRRTMRLHLTFLQYGLGNSCRFFLNQMVIATTCKMLSST